MNMNNNAIINVSHLSKVYKSYKKLSGLKGTIQSFFSRQYELKEAVSDFSLSIQKGEIVGLLGPNGAGKTTLMKMMTGIIMPSSGAISVNGHYPFDRKTLFKKSIGLVMGQKAQLWWDIPAMDSFELLKSYYEIPKEAFKERLEDMASRLNVKKVLHTHVRKLSLGERMKLELMASLIHRPSVLFLDEPTIGLDLISQEAIREFIKEMRKEYAPTIILTSHYMEDVKALCDRLVLIFDGKKFYDGSIDTFEGALGDQMGLFIDLKNDQSFEEKKSLFLHFQEKIISLHQHDQDLLKHLNQVEVIESGGPRKLCLKASLETVNILAKGAIDFLPIEGLSMGKAPIEVVMKEFLKNPSLLSMIQENHQKAKIL